MLTLNVSTFTKMHVSDLCRDICLGISNTRGPQLQHTLNIKLPFSVGLPLPESIAMSYEGVNSFPYNAGAILIHMPEMRRTHEAFLEFIFSNKQGLFFEGMGPLDQGAYNKYYEKGLKSRMMSQVKKMQRMSSNARKHG